MNLEEIIKEIALGILALPFLVVKASLRAYSQYQFLRVARMPAIACSCGSAVSLVGIWRCSCTYTYRGHLLRYCPLCGGMPRMVRCYACGLTTKLPEPADAETHQ